MDYQRTCSRTSEVETRTCVSQTFPGSCGSRLLGAASELRPRRPGSEAPLPGRRRRREDPADDVTTADDDHDAPSGGGGAAAAMAAPSLLLVLCTASALLRIAESCSSRSTPKPRPPSPTMRPNITFQTFDCPEAYAKWYCLNGATCFSVRVAESILHNCECADGFMGQRCEFKDLHGSYLSSRSRVMLETASIAGGVTVAVLLIFVLSIAAYTYIRRCKKMQRAATEYCDSERTAINSCNNNKESPVIRHP